MVVELCRSIEAGDLDAVVAKIEAGADVNARGKGNATPLFWAFLFRQPEVFCRLLDLGADPNVLIANDRKLWHSSAVAGSSVTHLATGFSHGREYFNCVFPEEGEPRGDPNLQETATRRNGETPLYTIVGSVLPDKAERVRVLVEKGADVNYVVNNSKSLATAAVGRSAQYGLALIFLKAGTDPDIKFKQQAYLPLRELVEIRAERLYTEQERTEYRELVQWLSEH